MTQPRAQLGPTMPICGAVGGAHGQAACAISKPITLM